MCDKEREDLISALRAYADSIKDDPIARRELLMSAGIVDVDGNLTEEYRE